MRVPVNSLQAFYDQRLGLIAARMINRRLMAVWPRLHDCKVLGLGYTPPFLPWAQTASRGYLHAMPVGQGGHAWPTQLRSASVIVDETHLPFRDSAFDRVLLVHAAEESESLFHTLVQVWRVSAPQARIVLVAANRLGVWSRLQSLPFGHGRAFTRDQLNDVLARAGFTAKAWAHAVFVPPYFRGALQPVAQVWESLGEKLWSPLGGVIMVEAIKQVPAPVGLREAARVRYALPGAVPARAG